ncbi:MAG: hypothetical protein DHS20C09_08430 [marine bacterium B5-7]|nr:MAG: hypothetical protein DHS20C09_08430 [marine bacterium B5-7]
MLNIDIKNRFYSLGDHFYSECRPKGLTNTKLVKCNTKVAESLGLGCEDFKSELFLQVFSGNTVLPGSRPLAQDYAGHQFGNFNAFLGDGRALLLFDTESLDGFWEVNLKGSGQTPYSREFDGRANLNSCLHEYELSNKLDTLAIPTTHSLCVIASDEKIYAQSDEYAATITRIAPSFIRFGTFENYFFQRDIKALRQLTEYVIRHYYPNSYDDKYLYSNFFREVVIRTARLIAHWQAVGFTHGMMNTDNQSILGITLDFGEASFTASHDPEYISSKHDEKGRYAFGQQPVIGLWNCNVLARALSPLIAESELKSALEIYETEYLNYFDIFSANSHSIS